MVVDLVAVRDDGSKRSDRVPSDPRRTLAVTIGEDVTIRLRCVTADGGAEDLSASTTSVVMTVRRKPSQSADRVIQKTATKVAKNGAGYAEIKIDAVDTRSLATGKYFYDVWLVRDTLSEPIIRTSPLVLLDAVRLA